jgi:hypothetical protein
MTEQWKPTLLVRIHFHLWKAWQMIFNKEIFVEELDVRFRYYAYNHLDMDWEDIEWELFGSAQDSKQYKRKQKVAK